MDVIVLADQQDVLNGSCTLTGKDGVARLDALCAWINGHSNAGTHVYFRLQLPLPAAKDFVAEIAVWHLRAAVPCSFVLPVPYYSPELVAAIEAGGFTDIIIACADDDKDLSAAAGFVNELRLNGARPDTCFSIWAAHQPGTANYSRLHSFSNSQDSITAPLFGPAKPNAGSLPVALSEQLENSQAFCALFNETLVMDIAGNIVLCPSVADVTGANLFTHTPEQLFLYKGKCSKKAGKTAACISCDYQGRFQWEQTTAAPIDALIKSGKALKDETPWVAFNVADIHQCNVAEMDAAAQEQYLDRFRERLQLWAAKYQQYHADVDTGLPTVSVETPAFKGAWLISCIESVLYQTSCRWTYYLVWDGGDALSHKILEIVQALDHPKLKVFFSENKGIARSRHFLSAVATEDYILPLDDDDMLGATIVEDLTNIAVLKPWASIIRARRRYIDENGNLVAMEEWFPFEKRQYQQGMVTDLHNHCQPTIMSRRAYVQTSGWEGFSDFYYAGEDCDIYLKLEEKGPIELFDKVLYYYRLNSKRTSHLLKPEGAYEMWRRLADKTIARIGLPVQRVNEQPPFIYEQLQQPVLTREMIDFVIPFYEADEKELPYAQRRPISNLVPQHFELTGYNRFQQDFPGYLFPCTRIELSFTAEGHAEGLLQVQITGSKTGKLIATGETAWKGQQQISKSVSVPVTQVGIPDDSDYRLSLCFVPARNNCSTVKVLFYELEQPTLFGRIFNIEKGYSQQVLDKCLRSLRDAGISEDAIYVINEKKSSSCNRNYGYSLTTRPLVCFMDDDAEITSVEALDDLLDVMAAYNADLIGPRLVTADDKIFCADPYFNEKLRPVPRGIGEPDDGRYQYISEVTWLPSTFLLLKKEVMTAINGFDEDYEGSQMEDVDLCLKARARNFKCIYAGHASVLHHNNQRNDRFAENFKRFTLKWGGYRELFTQVKLQHHENTYHN